ncbi:hypothetical protein FO440_09080 [Mucilaginibacter corticis]|uniref:Uncharacterized protein n=1 Tax=Mucilaginibacter corticis TaxID=2597670 RepID=A0A556MWQ8_9SPHI|nr:hypothetical protein [Mucilaginibacter corticis]TSJ44312.1 hypothetical protein FO440_09080 [Mucilaginibacter corticis]
MADKHDFSGMTVNERLYVSGQSDNYRDAVKKKDLNTAIAILKTIEIGDGNIKAVLKYDGFIVEDS